MRCEQFTNPEKWLIAGIPALFITGWLMHYIYEFSGGSALIGAIASVNESVWEHLKLALVPMIAWYGTYYILNFRKYNINRDKWFLANAVSLITSMLFTAAFYYTYTQSLGIESLFLDITGFFLGLVLGQFLALHIYTYGKGIDCSISMILLVLIVFVFVVFTFYPPHIPLFIDKNTGQYGI